jgi:hypothetical protein
MGGENLSVIHRASNKREVVMRGPIVVWWCSPHLVGSSTSLAPSSVLCISKSSDFREA